MPTKKTAKPTIDEIINKTIIATRLDSVQIPKDVYKATEKRLYAYPVIKAKIESDRELLHRYLGGDKPSKSNWFVRFQKNGTRLSDDEILETLIQDVRAKIAANGVYSSRGHTSRLHRENALDSLRSCRVFSQAHRRNSPQAPVNSGKTWNFARC